MATLTDKQQTLVWTVLLRGIAAHRAGLTGVVGIDVDRYAARKHGFVGDVAVQFGIGPLRGMPVGSPLFRACPLALASFGSLSNACQLFQADEAVWVCVHNAATDQMVALLFQPSLSPVRYL